MSLAASATLVTASSTSLLHHLAASLFTTPARACPYAARHLTSSAHRFSSTRRKLGTTTAYHPPSLEPPPAPPRNASAENTFIAGGVPQFNDIQTPQRALPKDKPANPVPEQRSGLPAEKPYASAAETSVAHMPKPRRKLRARKAAITLSPNAVNHLRNLLELPEPKLIRVGVKNKGCSGMAYNLEYTDKPGMFDEEVDQDGVKVLIDNKALLTIIGSEMDWVEDNLSQRFVFKNPNISKLAGVTTETLD
jgi:iron-sulfur cluster assembly protein